MNVVTRRLRFQFSFFLVKLQAVYKNVARWRLIRHHSEEAGVEGGQWPVDNGGRGQVSSSGGNASLHKKIYRKNTKKPSHEISFCTYVLLSFNRCIIAVMHSNQYKV